jgi:thioredoxin reductase
MEVFDVAVLGAGAAGLNASLVLGRARRKVALFDNGTNRNRVAHASHGFITRDGVNPSDFRKIALDELANYSSVQFFEKTVTQTIKRSDNHLFKLITSGERVYYAEKILLATGIHEVFPAVPEIRRFYGKSIFSCPYCHGWELKDQPLIIIVENEDNAVHLAKLVYNWSRDLLVATNGQRMSFSKIDGLERRKIKVVTEPVKKLHGSDGQLQSVEFPSGFITKRTGGFILPTFYRPNPFAEQLGCARQENGALVIDEAGRTSQKNIYTAGESAQLRPSSLIQAAADGSKVAYTINVDITYERF